MPIEYGDFVRLEFTGKVKETGEVFDTTSEEVAIEAGLFVEQKQYGPIPIIVGGDHLLKAIDDAVVGLDEGDSKIIDVTPENGFGQRDAKLIQLVPMKEFKKQGMNPYPGMEVTAEGHTGRILTINGGRVKVDFNHHLAGKNLEYSVVVSKIIEDEEEKIKGMIQLHYAYPNLDINKTEIRIDGKKVSIKLDDITKYDQKSYMDITFARFRISKDIWENLDYEKVEFIDEFEKKEPEAETKEQTEEITIEGTPTEEITTEGTPTEEITAEEEPKTTTETPLESEE
ncbi:peptidylprolyl isomerase [Methanobrevibacter filiformis]|uniref:Peptidyl-prolyl cis-trans isomerase n=1 Tax=Methanobrevibacter filiformis TaxID=55758 RepID=A0A166DPH6_9EURY|nr:peptidylprolyl isomerase [Methanobrevibacter filiformis]KZX15821.1 FKBP-type peptidyl-prolyl cis-trans isomerase SlyD [Methanobrevibacter filiformis]